MKQRLLIFSILLLLMNIDGKAQVWEWTKPEPNGNSTNEAESPHDIAKDANGNIYVLGNYNGSLYLNNILREQGSSGSFLAKYDSLGNLVWYRIIKPAQSGPFPHYITATDLVVNTVGVFITGNFTPSSGNYGCPNPNPISDDYTYQIGSNTFISSLSDVGAFIARIDFNGGIDWIQRFTRALCEGNNYVNIEFVSVEGYLLASDNNNNIIFSCIASAPSNNISAFNFNGTAIPIRNNNGNGQILVVKMNSNAVVNWSNVAYNDVNSYSTLASITTDNSGNIFLYGQVANEAKFGNITFQTDFASPTVLVKINASGVWQSVTELCDFSYNILEGGYWNNPDLITCDDQNNVYALINLPSNNDAYIFGNFISGSINKSNLYILKLNNNNTPIWYKNFAYNSKGSSNLSYQKGYSVFYANNNLYLTGGVTFNSNYLQFSDLSIYSPCGAPILLQYFIAKADTSGTFKWVTSFCANSGTSGFAITAVNNSIYTCGYFRGGINTLGNFNGSSNESDGAHQIFFGKLKAQYIRVGAVSATQVAPGCRINIPFTSFGLAFSAGNRFIAELSNASGDFTNATAMGNVISTGSGVINATIPANLPMGTTGYKIRIRSTDTLATGYNYYAYADTGYTLTMACLRPTNPQVSNITTTSARLSWTPPPNCAVGYQLQYKTLAATQWTTLQFAASNRNITGLLPNTTYQWRVQTGCRQSPPIGSGNINGPNFTTASAFAAVSTDNIKTAENSAKIFVQPNPAHTNAVLTMQGNIRNATVAVTDLFGKTVWMKTSVNSNQEILPVQHLSAGTYFVKVVHGNETTVVKLIKQ